MTKALWPTMIVLPVQEAFSACRPCASVFCMPTILLKPCLFACSPAFQSDPSTLHPAPCTLHPTPFTLHAPPCTLLPTPALAKPFSWHPVILILAFRSVRPYVIHNVFLHGCQFSWVRERPRTQPLLCGKGPFSLPFCLPAPPLPPTSPQSGSKSPVSIALICTTSRRIAASAIPNHRLENGDLIPL